MSKATKRKHVTKEVLDDYYVPEGNEEIAKVVGGRGNNLHEVQKVDGTSFLVSMPSKFRKNVWIKRGDFVIITPISEGNKVQGEIIYVLYSKQIKYLREESLWPTEFDQCNDVQVSDNRDTSKEDCSDDGESEEDDLLMENPNRPKFVYYNDDDTSSDDDTVENHHGTTEE